MLLLKYIYQNINMLLPDSGVTGFSTYSPRFFIFKITYGEYVLPLKQN